jgi:hypothetical protein
LGNEISAHAAAKGFNMPDPAVLEEIATEVRE